jgi:P4 family phage/plasmid primase-like protien
MNDAPLPLRTDHSIEADFSGKSGLLCHAAVTRGAHAPLFATSAISCHAVVIAAASAPLAGRGTAVAAANDVGPSKGNTADAIAFLRLIAPQGPWIPMAIHAATEAPVVDTFMPEREGAAFAWISERQGSENLYFVVNEARGPLRKKPSKDDMALGRLLFADCDPKTPGPASDPAVAEERARIRARLEACDPPPTYIIDSGNGFQALWALAEPTPDLDAVEAANRWLQVMLDGDACWNRDRIARLPGTINIPAKAKIEKRRSRELARLVLARPERKYRLSDFSALLGEGEAPALLRFIRALPISTRMTDLIRGIDHPDHHYGSRSERVFAVLIAMIAAGCSDDDMRTIFLDRRWPISAHVLEKGGETCIRRQIKKARESVGKSAGDGALSPSKPVPSARAFIDKRYQQDGYQVLFCHKDDFYNYSGTQYSQLPDDALRAGIYEFLDKARTPGGLPFDPTARKVNDVIDALKAEAHLSPLTQPPCWLPGAHNDTDSAADLVAVSNGLIHLPTLALYPHTPLFFNLMSLDFAFDPDATCPQWHTFLGQLWPEPTDTKNKTKAEVEADATDKTASITCLQEIFGYVLSGDTRQHTIPMLVGPRRSGKGTIARVLTGLMGRANVVSPTLHSLSTEFGLWPLIAKPLAIIADARVGSKSDRNAITERLLSISGEDKQTINRKHKSYWTGQLPTRFLILANELLRFPDLTGALASRYVPLPMTISFLGREDTRLTDKLLTELPGIFNWAHAGWCSLQERGHFELPASARIMLRQLERLGSAIQAFVQDRCIVEQGATIIKGKLYEDYAQWCQTQKLDVCSLETFARNLRAAVPTVKSYRPQGGGTKGRPSCWRGLRLRRPEEEPEDEIE